ncbi:MAG: aspartyl/asparaginyl beta-hydroxylase domain-containing protein [Reyranella sp.]|nr:aspartyl/asparaginyl beta-hydroxylase domain-containing protein [Reyranella sp.]
MQKESAQGIGHKGRFYLTKNIWLPQQPLENFNLKMSDMILRRMPKLPLAGEDAVRAFPVLDELKKSHAKIKADLEYLLSHHEEIPALHEVHPRDLYVPGRAWRTFLLKLWGHDVKENAAAVPDTMAAIAKIPGVHTALFSILHGYAEIEPHRGSAAGVVRFHYPLIVPTEPEKCWIEIGGHHFFWEEGQPLVFDDTREHWVKNQTDQTRVVLIIDFNADMPFPVNLYTGLRYKIVRRSAEIRTAIERASIGVPPRNPVTQTTVGLISGARSTTTVPAASRSDARQ